MRRILISLSTVLVAVVGTAASAPAAFAMRVIPPGDGPAAPARSTVVVHGHGGLAVWELAVIAVAVAVVLVAASLVVVYSRRRVVHPAAV